MTSYEKIYDRFLQKITDYKMLDLSDTEIRQECVKWLSSAIAKFRRCKNDLSQRDDELETFTVELLDVEIEILSTLMVSEWLAPQLNSVLYTSQFFGGKEEKLSDSHTVRCSWKRCSVFLRKCWETLIASMLKQKDEISLYGIALKSLEIG